MHKYRQTLIPPEIMQTVKDLIMAMPDHTGEAKATQQDNSETSCIKVPMAFYDAFYDSEDQQ